MIQNHALVTLTGWLNDPKTFDWGSAAKISIDVRKKNDLGQWETVDKVVYDVISDEPFPDAERVTVSGRITGLNVYEKRDKTTGVSVKVRASSVFAAEEIDAPF